MTGPLALFGRYTTSGGLVHPQRLENIGPERLVNCRDLKEGNSVQAALGEQMPGPKLVGQNAFASIEYPIRGKRTSVGSASNGGLVLAHSSVSSKHALIRKR